MKAVLKDINRIEEERGEDGPWDVEIKPKYRSHSVAEESNPLYKEAYE